MAPDLRSSYAMQGAIGVDQQVGRLGTISVNYLTARGDHQFLTRVFTPNIPNAFDIPNAYNFQYGSGGVYNQQQFRVNANIRTKTVTAIRLLRAGFCQQQHQRHSHQQHQHPCRLRPRQLQYTQLRRLRWLVERALQNLRQPLPDHPLRNAV